jgi:hypothetical protein
VSCRVYVTQVRRPVLRIVHARAAKLSLFIILLWSQGAFFNNILKNTKHNEMQENARRIQAGMCTAPKLTSNWHSRADTLSLSPTAVSSLRVRNPRHRSSSETVLLGKFVRELNRSWTGAFVNRGSSVISIDSRYIKFPKYNFIFSDHRHDCTKYVSFYVSYKITCLTILLISYHNQTKGCIQTSSDCDGGDLVFYRCRIFFRYYTAKVSLPLH